jgi:GntR family transcriptional repressor for pyruvate dehydrogenase complex
MTASSCRSRWWWGRFGFSYSIQPRIGVDCWPAVAADLRAQHRSVLDAIAKGEVEAASDAVEAHIRGFFAGLR